MAQQKNTPYIHPGVGHYITLHNQPSNQACLVHIIAILLLYQEENTHSCNWSIKPKLG